ncbi:MAG: YggT family protein [Anaerolineae bacterium]|nr:YggT family protein [Anaerolineae bacterium]
MTISQPTNEIAVDRREETVVTQQPGYAATEQVTRDVAAERRQTIFMVQRIMWSILGFLEILLALRFMLKLIAANPDSGFAALIYGVTAPFIAPFALLIGTPTSGGMILEVTTLFAMSIYALAVWGIGRVIQIASDRPISRTVSRSTREQTGAGTERTTHTTTSD